MKMIKSTLILFFILKVNNLVADSSYVVFNDSNVLTYELNFSQPKYWDSLLVNYANPNQPYMVASFTFNGITYDSIGARLKGNTSYFSYYGPKKSFKIKFDEYKDQQRFYGLKTINLNNGFKDPTFMREKIMLDLLRKYVPAMRANYVKLYINGECWGLYLQVEQVNKDFTQHWFGNNEDGNLFKGDPYGNLAWHGVDPENYKIDYELQTNESIDDWSDLIRLIEVINKTPDIIFPFELEKVFNVINFLKFQALNSLFVNLDSYFGTGHNYYIYHVESTDKFFHIPWDVNTTFGNFNFDMSIPDLQNLDIFWFKYPGPRPLIERLFRVDGYRTIYLRQLKQLVKTDFTEDSLFMKIDYLHDFIKDDYQADPYRNYSMEEFESNINNDVVINGRWMVPGIKKIIGQRINSVSNQLQMYGLGEIKNLYINEFMALNNSTIADEFGGYEDWIELYNNNIYSLDLDGLYLTDNITNPTKWMLPDTQIKPKGFLLIWLDGDPDQGSLHANFKLNAQGEQIGIFDIDGVTPIDTMTYSPQAGDSSWGRKIDGANEWQYFSPATPGYSNSTENVDCLLINEFMASNSNAIIDNFSEYDDWIEIYNPDNRSKNIGGIYLTDDISDRAKWQLPEVTIEAYGFLLIWVDNDPEQGSLHTNFKLNADGEQICIFDRDGYTLLDSITFGQQTTDISYGRIPDGNIDWIYFEQSTPGGPNISTSVNPLSSNIPEQFILYQNYPNPFNTQTTIKYQLANNAQIDMAIYDILGKKVKTLFNCKQSGGDYFGIWDGKNDGGEKQSAGIYFYQMKINNKLVMTKKLLLLK